MEIKDVFLTIGILSTFLIGIFNLYFTFINRKNSLREHIYKEQIRITSLLFNEFYYLNTHISELMNNPEADNLFMNKYDAVGVIIFQNEHIISSEIIAIANDTLIKSTDFLVAFTQQNVKKINKTYEAYFLEYYDFVHLVRVHNGIDSLSKENQTLYKLPNKKITL